MPRGSARGTRPRPRRVGAPGVQRGWVPALPVGTGLRGLVVFPPRWGCCRCRGDAGVCVCPVFMRVLFLLFPNCVFGASSSCSGCSDSKAVGTRVLFLSFGSITTTARPTTLPRCLRGCQGFQRGLSSPLDVRAGECPL